MHPQYGETIKRGQRYRARPGVYAFLVRGSDMLLTHQMDPKPEFQLPGGGIDPGEQLFSALHREVREETGWSISSGRRIGFYRRFVYMPEYDLWAEKLCSIYVARPILQVSAPLEAGHSAHMVPISVGLDMIESDADRIICAQFAGLG